MLKIFIQLYASTITAASFFMVLFPVALFSLIFKSKFTRLKIITPGWMIFGNAVLKIACFCKIYVEDHRSEDQKCVPPKGLYICNHQSLIDIPLLLTQFSIPPIMKKEIMLIPFFGVIARASGAMPVDRKDKNSRVKVLKLSQERLLEGFPVQVYPEGTRSKTGHPKTFDEIKTKLIDFAYENNVHVIACSSYGTNHLLSKKGFANSGTQLGLIINKEVFPKDFSSKEEFAKHCWHLVVNGYEKMNEKFR